MKPAAEEEYTGEVLESGGLLGGVTAWHLRLLCENPWEGGAGYTPQEVAQMTLDQVWFRLCALDTLKTRGRQRMQPLQALGVLKPDKDGYVRGRAADGTPIRGRITGKSLAQKIRESKKRGTGSGNSVGSGARRHVDAGP